MRALLISIGKILAFFAIWVAGVAGAVWASIQLFGPEFDKDVVSKTGAEALFLLAIVVPLLIMALAVDRRPVSTLGLPAGPAVPGLVMGTLIGVLIFCLPVGILIGLGYAQYAPDFSQFDPVMLGWLLLAMFLNVIDQELLVRSYLFQEVWAKYSATAAVVVSTIVFVALHAGAIMKGTPGLIAAADIALASIMLGIAYLRSGALWLPIGIHFGWNAFQGPVLGINVTGMELGGHWHAFTLSGPELWTGGAMGVEGGLAGLAGPLLGIVIVMLFPKKPSPFAAPA